MYTDSKYVFHILHHHATIWRGSSFLITKGTSIANMSLYTKAARSLLSSQESENYFQLSNRITLGKAFANKTAKEVCQQSFFPSLILLLTHPYPEIQWQTMGVIVGPQSCLVLQNWYCLPDA